MEQQEEMIIQSRPDIMRFKGPTNACIFSTSSSYSVRGLTEQHAEKLGITKLNKLPLFFPPPKSTTILIPVAAQYNHNLFKPLPHVQTNFVLSLHLGVSSWGRHTFFSHGTLHGFVGGIGGGAHVLVVPSP
jgi:hypothetical protein